MAATWSMDTMPPPLTMGADHDEKDIPWILRLLGVGKKRRQSDADGHIRFDGYAEEAEEENGNVRQRKDGRKDIELFKVCRSCG